MELNTRTSKKMTLLWATACSYERLSNKLSFFRACYYCNLLSFGFYPPHVGFYVDVCIISLSVLFKLQSYVGKYSLHEGETNRKDHCLSTFLHLFLRGLELHARVSP